MTGTRPLRSEPSKPKMVLPPPRPVDFSQAEARVQWAQGWSVHYRTFDARAEVEQVCRPLARAVSDLFSDGVVLRDMRCGDELFDREGRRVRPIECLWDVRQVARSVGFLRVELVKVLAGLPVSRLPEGAQARLVAVVRDGAHEQAPDVEADLVVSGAWVDLLVAHVAPLAEDLAAVVAGQPAGVVSDLDRAICEALSLPSRLGEGFTARVSMLERRLPELRARHAGALRTRREVAGEASQQEQERQAQALRNLGLPS